MNLGELLKLIDQCRIEKTEIYCYKRLYLSLIEKEGNKSLKEISYNKCSEISSSTLNLKVVSIDAINKRSFMFSIGLEIYISVLQ